MVLPKGSQQCMDAHVELWHNWGVATDDPNKMVRILFLNHRKPFDHIDRNKLMRKMIQLGLPSFVVRWLTSFLCERQQRVPMGGHTSDWLRVLGGVKQGTRTGPIAFLFMINDLLSNRYHAKFVDDTTVRELCEDLRTTEPPLMWRLLQLAETEAWSAVNNMVRNGDKTKEMRIHFGRTGAGSAPVLIDNTVVEHVTSFKLLGCTVNNQLTITSRGKIMLTTSTPRPAGGCTFCAYSEGPGLSHKTLSESSPLQFAPF